jgi:Arc/MetJ family transcription regulator
MRTNVVLDDDLVEEGFRLTGVRTKRALLHLALSELIRIRRKKNLGELAGQISFTDDFDHKELRDVRSNDRRHLDMD